MNNQAVRSIVAEVLEAIRPEELLILDAANPNQGTNRSASGGPMGIGVTIAAGLIAPIVWKIVESLAGDVLKEGSTRTAKFVTDYVIGKFHTTDSNAIEAKISDYAARELADSDLSVAERAVAAAKIADAITTKFKLDMA